MTTQTTIPTAIGDIPSPSNWAVVNEDMYQTLTEDAAPITVIEKQNGRTSVEDIKDALEEYERLYKAGIASDAEILTLSRAYPNNVAYSKAIQKIDGEPVVVGGPASVELIDREGHLITTDALKKAFQKYMANFRTRNTMVLHSDVQVGWALPAYISKGGQIFKSGVDDKGLFFVTEIRKDTKIANKVLEQINEGKLKSYSIAGSATKTQNMQKGLMPYMQVDEMELAEITVCEKGVNQGAGFDILKANDAATKTCTDGSCLVSKSEGCDCGCDESPRTPLELMIKSDGDISFIDTLKNWMQKEDDPLKSGTSFTTLNNFAGRDAEHHQLLREYGFPSEQPQEGMRYTPVIETETDDYGIPMKIKPPRIVNEAGQNLGNRHDEDAPTYGKSVAGKAAAAAKESGHPWYSPEVPITKSNEFFTWIRKEHGKPHWCKEHNRMETGEHKPAEIEKDAGSAPSMGWFDMLKAWRATNT